MDNELIERLKKLKIEEVIWIILIGIIILSFHANEIERDYLLTNNEKSKNKYRSLQIFIFTVASLTYLYYTIDGYRDIKKLKVSDSRNKVNNTYLAFLSSLLIMIAGAILIYIAAMDADVEIELALN